MAIAEHRAAIRLRPDVAEFHDDLGITLAMQKKLDEAVGEFRAALRLAPDEAKYHSRLGLALKQKGNRDEAVGSQCRSTEKLWPSDASENRFPDLKPWTTLG